MFDKLRGLASLVRTLRQDGWENALTGLGTSRDKRTYGRFAPSMRVSDMELNWLYHHHDLSARIVDTRPKETFRQGFKVEIPDDSELAEEINQDIKERELLRLFQEGDTWGRLYGGAVLIAGIDDGRDMAEPLTDDAPIRSVRHFTLLDKRYVTAATYYEDPTSPKFMEVETYQIVAPTGKVLSRVHETRLIRFGGALTDAQERRANSGWDHSVLQRCYDVCRDFDANWQAVNHLVSDASQAVFKIKGLINAITTPQGAENMQTRMQLVDMCRSVARAVVLDADHGEEFERKPTTFTGLPEILTLNMSRIAATAEIPQTILFGRSPAGQNATGESDFRWFYDSIKSEQTNRVEPMLRRAIGWLLRAADGPAAGKVPEKWSICFASLWQETPLEKATREKLIADRNHIYVQDTVWTPEEVALSISRNGFDGPVEIDEDMRETLLEHEKEMAENPPAPPVGNNGTQANPNPSEAAASGGTAGPNGGSPNAPPNRRTP